MIPIEDFIKHLESKGYDKEIGDKSYIRFYSSENKRQYSYNISTNTLIITEYPDEEMPLFEDVLVLFHGFIESLEQFDLIDRLTS